VPKTVAAIKVELFKTENNKIIVTIKNFIDMSLILPL
jgi:hypothetical protein